ncbi:Copper amine oxidase N-terminal domain-containing protein [Peptoclostridium litorale DSM 5388]|uniref:Copper amine oxidase-like N-terminal domain-containing protein n=1 Tax=Peptoclostridium litorale DSM 5388 TaxID=1121324 RepID=A0A069RHW4_PEPLI|nr:stalk domain-containing protein [Peptoclostridium litorale]KDR95745.1 hypothetical protein CLIT_10c04720 [Peptoclostridium litorale DSM 5388]SIO22163.1 Copper amine oxidase N-terminal domain-containing protein [Peptoclostridium litorale DSM 5388]
MKKTFKGFVMGFLSAVIIGASFSFAQISWQSIYVAFNAANVEVNGNKLESDIITYQGTTYAPVKELSEALGKQVEWDEQTSTVTVKNSPVSIDNLFSDMSDFIQTMLGVIVGGLITYIVIVKRAIKKLKA